MPLPRPPKPRSDLGFADKRPPTPFNPARGQNASIQGGGGFNKGAAGSKTYGMGRAAPNMGKTANKAGYGKRDAMNARANAIQKRLGGM